MKIYYNNQWISVTNDDNRIKELNIRIEEGARIDTIVLNSCHRYKIILCNNKIIIGCEVHSIEEWEKDGLAIANKYSISVENIEYYRNQVNKLKNFINE